MNNLFVLLFCLGFTLYGHAQITFEKGYYINNLDQREEGSIKNKDWKSNPSQFEFKDSENTAPKTVTLKYAKEFGFEDGSKYIRATVNVDRSSTTLNTLSSKRASYFIEEELFLKVLVEGDAALYRYEDGNLTRYFYSTNDKSVKPLVYKEYIDEGRDLKKNEAYKQELYNTLKCASKIIILEAEPSRYSTEKSFNI